MRILAVIGILLLFAHVWLPAQSKQAQSKQKAPVVAVTPPPDPKPELTAPATERLTYGVEWRLIRAGTVEAESRSNWAHLRLESAGLVSKLYKIEDAYSVNYEDPFCATVSVLDAKEGKRHRETRVQYDRVQNHAYSTERDLVGNAIVHNND